MRALHRSGPIALSIAALVLGVLLILSVVAYYQAQVRHLSVQLTKVETGYTRLHGQVNRAHLQPDSPSLPVLLGPLAGPFDLGAPPVVRFAIPVRNGTLHLTCTDQTGAGNYVCAPTKKG